MKAIINKLITNTKEAFRPLPTHELVVEESLDLVLGGLACTSTFTTRRLLICPDCKVSQLFR